MVDDFLVFEVLVEVVVEVLEEFKFWHESSHVFPVVGLVPDDNALVLVACVLVSLLRHVVDCDGVGG